MKKILIFLSFLVIASAFTSCKKDLEKITMLKSITANVLSPLTSNSFVLNRDSAAKNFQTFNWTTIDYGFATPISYTVQVDRKKNKFSAPFDVVTVSNLLKGSINVGDFNKILLNMGIATDVADTLVFRVKAVINSKVTPVYSNPDTALVTPYATVFLQFIWTVPQPVDGDGTFTPTRSSEVLLLTFMKRLLILPMLILSGSSSRHSGIRLPGIIPISQAE
jgi:hypothetical protein